MRPPADAPSGIHPRAAGEVEDRAGPVEGTGDGAEVGESSDQGTDATIEGSGASEETGPTASEGDTEPDTDGESDG